MFSYYLQFAFRIIVFFLPFYIILRFFYLKYKNIEFSWLREISLACFFLFSAFLGSLLFESYFSTIPDMLNRVIYRLQTGHQINIIPFLSINSAFRNFQLSYFVINIVGNILMFVPFGFFLPLLWKKWQSWKKILLFGLLLPVLIETFQLFLYRFVDVDDVILNFIGINIGYFLFRWLYCYFPALKKVTI